MVPGLNFVCVWLLLLQAATNEPIRLKFGMDIDYYMYNNFYLGFGEKSRNENPKWQKREQVSKI